MSHFTQIFYRRYFRQTCMTLAGCCLLTFGSVAESAVETAADTGTPQESVFNLTPSTETTGLNLAALNTTLFITVLEGPDTELAEAADSLLSMAEPEVNPEDLTQNNVEVPVKEKGLLTPATKEPAKADAAIPPVPEPGTMALMGLGMAGIIGLIRRLRRQAKSSK